MAKKPKDLPSLDADVTEVKDGVATTSFSDAFSNLTNSPQKEENLPTLSEQPKKKTGRPSKYTKEIADQICEQLSEGIPLREICRQEGFPAWRTIYDWMYRDEDLSAAIAHARDMGYDSLAEECLHIADTPVYTKEESVSTDDKGAQTHTLKTVEMLGHRKLQIETRLKLLAKFHPTKYGDKLVLGGDKENPLQMGDTVFGGLLTNIETKLQLSLAAPDK